MSIIGAIAIVGAVALVGAVLWRLGALDAVEWRGDFVTAVIASLALYATIAVGFVVGRWWTVLLIWLTVVTVIVVQQLGWQDDPSRSGTDDLPPSYGLRFTPLVMLLPTVGVALQRWIAFRRTMTS